MIDAERRCWIQKLIDNIFLPHEASTIKSIPLSLGDCADKIFWPHNTNGEYSVKSGNRVLMDQELNEKLGASDQTKTKRVWKGIWSLKVPNRVKTLIWQAGLDSLLSKVNLRRRKIPKDDICQNCGLDQETTFHAIWSYPTLVTTGDAHFGWLVKETRKVLTSWRCFSYVTDLVELLAIMVSEIWTWRNKAQVDEAIIPLGMINHMASMKQ